MNTNKKIKMGMRRNEVEVLRHLRQHRTGTFRLFGRSWDNALDRLILAGRVRYDRREGFFRPRRGAGPVTGVVR